MKVYWIILIFVSATLLNEDNVTLLREKFVDRRKCMGRRKPWINREIIHLSRRIKRFKRAR